LIDGVSDGVSEGVSDGVGVYDVIEALTPIIEQILDDVGVTVTVGVIVGVGLIDGVGVNSQSNKTSKLTLQGCVGVGVGVGQIPMVK
jgi:hypothetical protein